MHTGLHEVDYARTWGYMWEAVMQGIYRVMYMKLPKLYMRIRSVTRVTQLC